MISLYGGHFESFDPHVYDAMGVKFHKQNRKYQEILAERQTQINKLDRWGIINDVTSTGATLNWFQYVYTQIYIDTVIH